MRLYFVLYFNDTATTEIYTLSLHDALPICRRHHDAGPARHEAARRLRPRRLGGGGAGGAVRPGPPGDEGAGGGAGAAGRGRSEEHTSEQVTPISRMPSSS